MQFCPKCNGFCITDYTSKQAVCSKCGQVVEMEGFNVFTNHKENVEKIVVVKKQVLRLTGLPRVKRKCRKCGNSEVYVRILASRSEDDFEEECYSCTNCGHSWREGA